MADAAEKAKLPAHVGIVMDGNGRWAKRRHLPRVIGHQSGVKAIELVVDAAREIGIRYLSLYAFSTENWNRAQSEVHGLMGLFRYYLRGKIGQMHRRGARVRFAGRLGALPEDIQEIMRGAEELTAGNGTIDVIFCVNYGGRQEILDAAARIARECPEEPMTEELFKRYTYLPDVPYPDLLIRTGGELRMSNFWLWGGAYSEYYFTDVYWPDFDGRELEKALESYAGRERRYGSA